MKNFLCVIMLVLCTFTSKVSAQIFGPANYQDCILKGLDSAKTESAVTLLQDTCEKKFQSEKNQGSVLSSIMLGNGRTVTCYFDSSHLYKDIVFQVSYEASIKATKLVFKIPDRGGASKLLARTKNRLSLSFKNNENKDVLLDIFFKTGLFSMKLDDQEFRGVCEEER